MQSNIKEILEKILLPIQEGWKLERIELDEIKFEVKVYLNYSLKSYNKNDKTYSLYDSREERKWRHIDLWQYKTFIFCELPRFKDEDGKIKTIDVPWADPFERMSWLLEKKR
jgi:transposase